jgi:acetoin utilization deacetylase AcuC-like enzyme
VDAIDVESNPLNKSKKSKAKAKAKAKGKGADSDAEVRTRKYSEKEAFGKMHTDVCREAVEKRIKELEEKKESYVRITVQNQVVGEMWDEASDDVKKVVRGQMAKDHGLGPIFESFPKIAELSEDERVKAIEAVRQHEYELFF